MALPLQLEDRKLLLRDTRTYFNAAEHFLRHSEHLQVESFVPRPQYQAAFGSWEGQIHFGEEHVLKFKELYRRHDDGVLERFVNMDFRKRHDSDVTFRVDAHGLLIIEDQPCHLDLPCDLTYEEGDPRLNGLA